MRKVRVSVGQIVKIPGQYTPAGSRGKEITMPKGHRMPPNQYGEHQYATLVDRTKVKNR